MTHHQQELTEIYHRKQTFIRKNDEVKFKIILVGDSGVGKTSLFLAFTDEDRNEQKPITTVTAVDFRLQPLEIDGEMIKLHIWDTAGQQRYRSMVESFFKGCQGAIIVFDLSNKKSFIHATTEWFKMCENRVSPSEIILIGNKADLQHSVTQKQVQQWCTKNHVTYFFTSVNTLQNIELPFVQLSKKMVKKKKDEAKVKLSSPINQNSKQRKPEQVKLNAPFKPQKKQNCC